MFKWNIMTKPRKKRKGQSTIEYLILVAAIIAALFIFLKPGGVFQNAFNETINTGTEGMQNMAGRLKNSRTNK
jgi:competence protein ComGC